MLDQNTDRMWYVIGAIVIGGLILTSSIVLFTDVAFAGVRDSMVSLVNYQGFEQNLLNDQNISIERRASSNLNHGGRIDDFELKVFNSEGTGEGTGGVRIALGLVPVQSNTVYKLSYEYEKKSGRLVSFGGHTDKTILGDVIPYVDGIKSKYNYRSRMSVYIDDHNERHTVEVYFETSDNILDPDVDNYIWIQPNRLEKEDVVVNIYNLKLVEVDN